MICNRHEDHSTARRLHDGSLMAAAEPYGDRREADTDKEHFEIQRRDVILVLLPFCTYAQNVQPESYESPSPSPGGSSFRSCFTSSMTE